MVRIRFRRVGARNQASFRIVAADKESPRDGRFLEVLGMYNPRTNPSTVRVDEARLFHWMSNGAQPSDSVVQTLQTRGTWERWERFKGGESLDILIQEAEAATVEVDPRTRRDDQIGQRSTKRRRHPDAEPAPEEPKAEAEVAEPAEAEATADAPDSDASEDDGEAPDAPENEAEAEETPEAAESSASEDEEAGDEAEADQAESDESEAEEPAADEADVEEAEPEADEAKEGDGE
ncbi:MAG: 30S ribosomal protein S16 [Anaerolineales bacterium]